MIRFLLLLPLALFASRVLAADEAFHAGPAIPDFGKIASVDSDMPIPKGTVFKVQFDVKDAAEAGKLNKTLESAARFINMHVENGVPLKNIHLAIVSHGPSEHDFLRTGKDGADNPNAPLVAALLAKGVDIYLCGQSAAYLGVKKEEMLPGVKLALSAMTAHALLSEQGYSLNPF